MQRSSYFPEAHGNHFARPTGGFHIGLHGCYNCVLIHYRETPGASEGVLQTSTRSWSPPQAQQVPVPVSTDFIPADGVRPDPEKVTKLLSWPSPDNRKEVQSFAGLANYYRRFCKDFAKKFNPLRVLLKANTPFEWSPSTQEPCDEVKSILTTPLVLMFPRLDQPFEVWTDASYGGLGAVLCQKGDDEQTHPVAYASRGLLKKEQNYAVTELAVVWALTHFQAYIVGQDVTVYTDHAALTSLLKAPKLSGRLMRWSLKLQQYKPTFKHRPGAMNSVAAALLRIPQTQALQVVVACLTSSTE